MIALILRNRASSGLVPVQRFSKDLWRCSYSVKAYQPLDPVNSDTTLPLDISSKSEIFKQVEAENFGKKFMTARKWMKFAKVIINFYKVGMKNVWNNRKIKNEILNRKYHMELINYEKSKNAKVKGKIGSGKELVNYLNNEIYIKSVENSKKVNKADASSINITRSEYQLVLRTEKDFIKLPIFGILFLIFEELTPLVCFAFPDLIPSTCIIPALRKKQELKQVELMDVPENRQLVYRFFVKDDLYEFSTKELLFLHETFKLSRFSRLLRSLNLMRNDLEFYKNQIRVDNHLIQKCGGFDALNNKELIICALQRGLLSSKSKEPVINVEEFKNGNGYEKGIDTVVLKLKLESFVMALKYQV